MSDQSLVNTAMQHKKSTKKLALYILGWLACIALTLFAYHLVQERILVEQSLYIVIAALGITQLIVQITCFLRLNTPSDSRSWNWIALVFTIIVIFILVTGSLWIMYNLNYYMVH
jgi:cytochrome o ubiquinol oxidase operon protein cyoD